MDVMPELNASSLVEGDKKRGKNYTAYEKELLLEILKRYPIIENKRNHNNINNKKQEAWDLVTNEYNSDKKVEKRERANLKSLWKNLKIKATKDRARHKKEMLKTRGGDQAEPMDKMSEGIVDLNPNQSVTIKNEFDEDHFLETEGSQGQSHDTPTMPSTLGQIGPSTPSTLGLIGPSTPSTLGLIGPSTPSTSAETPSVLGSRSGKKRKVPSSTPTTNGNTNEDEFHQMRMKYLKEEHDVKMQVHQHQLQFQINQTRSQMERHRLQMEILKYQQEYAIKQLHESICSDDVTI